MSIKQEAALLIDTLPDDTVELVLELLKKMAPSKQESHVSSNYTPGKRTLGVAAGKYAIPDDIDSCNEEIASMFGVVR